jgi:hypothetical protein
MGNIDSYKEDTVINNGNLPVALPSKIAITIWPGKVKFTTSQGFTAEGNYAWIKPGAKIFLYFYNHPLISGMSSKMSVKSVKVYRSSGATFAKWNPPFGLQRFKEDFTAGDRGGMWKPIEGGGGNFKKFASFVNGAFVVDVPEKNWWGKTGIKSEHPIYIPHDDMSAAPIVFLFEVDPAKSKGFRFCLTDYNTYEDPWRNNTVFTGFSIDAKTNKGLFVLSNNADPKMYKEVKDLPPNPPAWIKMTVSPGYAKVETSLGQTLDGNFDWVKSGVLIHLLAYTHPYAADQASSMYLKSITVTR